MNVIDLTHEQIDMLHALKRAKAGPLILIGLDGQEYVLAEAHGFDHEVDELRASETFQSFLDTRLATKHLRRPVTDVLREIEAEIAQEQRTTTPREEYISFLEQHP